MEKSETIAALVKATIKVMQEVVNIEKNSTVGSGQNAYKAVSDMDVKEAIGQAMALNGLTIFQTDVQSTETISEWDEEDQWSKSTPKAMKRKQSVFTKVTTKYLLCHESGEFITLTGYGHGVDPQDKSAGKATTYALKYTLLYTFMVATGKIDDSDKTHSNDVAQKSTTKKDDKQWLNNDTPQWKEAVKYIAGGGKIDAIKKKYKLSKVNEQKLIDESIQGV